MCAVGGAALPSCQRHRATVEGQIRRAGCEKVSLMQAPSLCVCRPEGNLPRKVDLTRLLWEEEEGDSHLSRIYSVLRAVPSVPFASPLNSHGSLRAGSGPCSMNGSHRIRTQAGSVPKLAIFPPCHPWAVAVQAARRGASPSPLRKRSLAPPSDRPLWDSRPLFNL